MASDSEQGSRRENPVLEPIFDQLRTVVDYSEVSLYRTEAGCLTLVTYRGPVPQAQALSLTLPERALNDWHQALTTGRPVIMDDSPSAAEELARSRQPLVDLLGVSPEAHPKSMLTVPLHSGSRISFLLILGHSETRFYTTEHGERVRGFALGQMPAIQTGARYAELAGRAAEAQMLLAIQRAIASRLERGAALGLIAEEARRLTFSRTALIVALEGSELVLQTFSGERPAFAIGRERWPANPVAIACLDGPVSSLRGDEAGRLGEAAAVWLGDRDFLAVPLRQGSQVTGLLLTVEKRLGIYDAADERRLCMLASAAGVCLENAQLYRQARLVAALEERDRLSRELHDQLAQALSYVKMRASLADEKVRAGDGQAAQAHLSELKAVADGAYSSVREAIFGLRHPGGASSSFFASLDGFLADYRSHYGLDVTLEMALDPPPKLEPEVELQLARIVQESMTNVRRHAAARHACVQVNRKGESIVVRIIDDGQGFDVDAALSAEGQHFGLQVMRERAESFSGRVALVSAPGRGTEVMITIPTPED